ncbi:hypothetical protein [Bdellovibrio sp. HCB337]|uniref:hypothetical protein n=1 Tax=Bdellovibrio sp. HCB337 TaxID=3394358 RepID=UPI0039A40347
MKLQYVLVPGQRPHPEMRAVYQEVYKFWEASWEKAFNDLQKPAGFLKSDAFTRQDYVGGVLVDGKCLGLCFYRVVDASMPTTVKDSYFANWGDTHMQKLRSRGDKIVVMGNLTVSPEARGAKLGFSMKDLILGTAAKVFTWLEADAMTLAPRRDRNVQRSCAMWGAETIAMEIPSGHGDNVDLMSFFPDVMETYPRPELGKLVDTLWEDRLHVPQDEIFVESIAA